MGNIVPIIQLNNETISLNGEVYIHEKSKMVIPSMESGINYVRINLTNNKISYLYIPSDITEKDIEIIKHHIDGILLKISLES